MCPPDAQVGVLHPGRLGFGVPEPSPGCRSHPCIAFLQQVKLEEFGRPKIDGELKVRSIVNHTKQDR